MDGDSNIIIIILLKRIRLFLIFLRQEVNASLTYLNPSAAAASATGARGFDLPVEVVGVGHLAGHQRSGQRDRSNSQYPAVDHFRQSRYQLVTHWSESSITLLHFSEK